MTDQASTYDFHDIFDWTESCRFGRNLLEEFKLRTLENFEFEDRQSNVTNAMLSALLAYHENSVACAKIKEFQFEGP